MLGRKNCGQSATPGRASMPGKAGRAASEGLQATSGNFIPVGGSTGDRPTSGPMMAGRRILRETFGFKFRPGQELDRGFWRGVTRCPYPRAPANRCASRSGLLWMTDVVFTAGGADAGSDGAS